MNKINLKMKLLKATLEDIPELVPLIQTSYRGEKGLFRDTHLLEGERVNPEMIEKDLLSTPTGFLWKYVLEEDNSPPVIVGCVYTDQQMDRNMLFIGTLCVHPDYQTLGIGKILMKAAEERAKELKCCAVTLQVVKARTALIQWYERQGYRLTGESMPFPEGKYGGFKVSPDDLAMISLQKDF